MKAISDLNYHPNLHARSLAKGDSRTLGMIASNLENPFFFDIFRTLEADAYTHGYEVLVANTFYDPDHLVRCVRLMIGRRVAGLAVIVSEIDPDLIRELAASGLRVVFYDVGSAGRTMSNIRINYRRGIERVVEYLHNSGHRKLAFVDHHATLGPLGERESAFIETVSRYARGMAHGGKPGLVRGRATGRPRDPLLGIPAHRNHLRQRCYGRGGAAGSARPRPERARGYLSHKVRQYQAV